MSKPRTIIEKVWDAHLVSEKTGAPALLFIDLHLVHALSPVLDLTSTPTLSVGSCP